jgi:hypothetical protein
MKRIKNQEKSGENLKNQLLNSGEFSSGENFKNQESPDQIRRFGNPGYSCNGGRRHYRLIKIEKRNSRSGIINLKR